MPISGAKNAALTLLPCSLLTDEPLTLRNLPRLADVDGFGHLLNELGVSTTVERGRGEEPGRVITLSAAEIASTVAPYDMVRKMRASIVVLGPLLARAGEATVSLPGGCAIGNRPIDFHLKALEALGAQIELAAGYVKATAPARWSRRRTRRAALPLGRRDRECADGGDVVPGRERHRECRAGSRRIIDLCRCLIAMGSEIDGLGTDRLTIQGKDALHGATYRVMPDRIEAGSYACAAAITGGELMLVGARGEDLRSVIEGFVNAGIEIEESDEGIRVKAEGRLRPLTISTAPYPAFPTDMQAQFMAMLALADGASVLTETIFENRYMHVPELARMARTSRSMAAPQWCAASKS